MENTIKNKQLNFKYQDIIFKVKIKYDTSPFGVGNKSFWKTELFQVNDEKLLIPLTYLYIQSRGWLQQKPTTENHHNYNNFDECWNQITYTDNKIKYFNNINDEVIFATTNTYNNAYCILPKMDIENLTKLISIAGGKEVILLISDNTAESFVKFLFDFKMDNWKLNWYISISYKDKPLSKEEIISNKMRLFKEYKEYKSKH